MTFFHYDVTHAIGYCGNNSTDAVVFPDEGSVTLKPMFEQDYPIISSSLFSARQFFLIKWLTGGWGMEGVGGGHCRYGSRLGRMLLPGRDGT